MRKCYVSGKIGKPEEGQSVEAWEKAYMEKFQKASEYVLSVLGMDPVNPTLLPHNHGRTWRDYMNEDIEAMLPCDAIYMIEDWMLSEGAVVEHTLAKGIKMEVHYPPGWEKLPDVKKYVEANCDPHYTVPLLLIDGFMKGALPKYSLATYQICFFGRDPYWKLRSLIQR